jgi:hypothetical protein
MSKNFMGLDGIRDAALLRAGAEALAIGFPLDGPVHDAMVMCLLRMRRAEDMTEREATDLPPGHVQAHEYLMYLGSVKARYPDAYDALAREVAEALTKPGAELFEVSPLLTPPPLQVS